MYQNIGAKLQGLAKVVFVLGALGFVIYGIVNIRLNALNGILTIILGILGSWISSWAIYGLGECAEAAETQLGKNVYSKSTKRIINNRHL